MENFKRKKTDTFTKLFNGDNIKIELLEIVKSENIYFIKNKINEYTKREDQKHNVKRLEQIEQEQEQETNKKLIESKVSYANYKAEQETLKIAETKI